MKKRFSRLAVTLLIGVLAVQTTGCFGTFTFTRKIYALNKSLSDDKWVQWIVFLAFSILPVYAFGGFVDSIVLNSLEFWTGENPMEDADLSKENIKKGTSQVELDKDTTLTLTRDPRTQGLTLELARAGQSPLIRIFEPLENGMVVRDQTGQLVLEAREGTDGAIQVTDDSGQTLAVHSLADIQQVREAFLRGGSTELARVAMDQALTGPVAVCARR